MQGSFDCVVVRFARDNFAQDDNGGKLMWIVYFGWYLNLAGLSA